MPERKSSYTFEDLVACAHGDMFGPNNARLPLPPMLMIDRVKHISATGGIYGKGQILAELDIRPDLWFFDCHFESDPVMPGCLGLDAMWQLVGFFLVWAGGQGRGRALAASDVKFSGMVMPSAKLVSYHIDLKRVVTRRLVVGIGDGVMKVDGEPIYEAKNLQVGLFTDEQMKG